MASNETSKYKLSVVEGTELKLSLNGSQGPIGPANELFIGTVTTAETGVPAAALITGAAPTQTLHLTLPKGNTGATGAAGPAGPQGLAGDKYQTTSSTNLLIPAIGDSITITIGTGLSYSVNQTILVSHDINNHIHAEVDSYNPTTGVLVAVVTDKEGSGTYSSWVVNLSGAVGAIGPQGPEGPIGPAGADGADALWNYTGEYNVGASYAVGDVATYDGETFYRIDANGGNTGDTPSNVSPYWDLLAAKGVDGSNDLPLAGGTMDADATIALDIAPDGNGFSTDSEVAGWGFGVQQKENGTNTGLLSYIYTTGFYAESSPAYVTVNASGIPSYGTLDGGIFRKVADYNFKPSYEGDFKLRYSGERWYMADYGGTEIALADIGDESYPWQASWPLYIDSIIPSVNQTTHLSSTELTFDNGSKLKKGTTDAGLGGNGGIALKCSVDYELKWDAGRLYTMEQDGFTIRRVDHCRNIAPTGADDVTKGFVVGSIWTLDDGISYECTGNTEGGAAWVAHFPLTIGDGLSFNTGTNTILCNSNIARRAGNQTFTGVNTFSGQVELTGQALTNGTSAVTRDLGDVRYGTTYVGVNENNVSSTNNTPITLASITLPIGRYQIESCISATAASSAGGFLFGLSSSAPIKVTLVESYGNDNAVTLSNSIGSDSTASIQRSIGTGTSYRRLLTGIIDIITANTVVSIEFCQSTTNAIASTTRKRAYITARKIA